MFDAPYNRQMFVPRLYEWGDWKSVVLPLFGRSDHIKVCCVSIIIYIFVLPIN